MSDPGDKSDDLISELARLMASSATGGESAVKPLTRPAPLNAEATSPNQVRIPGMDNTVPGAMQPTSPTNANWLRDSSRFSASCHTKAFFAEVATGTAGDPAHYGSRTRLKRQPPDRGSIADKLVLISTSTGPAAAIA